ncbi:hypothetical protein GIB67_014455 [Kingdonia uniflora]|uniref:Retrotransposon Copia-like N-terminal domain-containing protein n=1 Tax=Kingdonia uniflora TaxID=39325 RepID=A0A7J7LZ29_9MAGN|nr:hypothetical protein GIB67_014455 [Kingdonia uniflora]
MAIGDESSSSSTVSSIGTSEDVQSFNYIHDNPNLKITSQLFDGLNYVRWAQSVKLFVDGREKIRFFLDTEKEPVKSDLKYAKWFSDDLMVRTWLINSIQPTISSKCLFTNNAHLIWESLRKVYSQRENNARIFQLSNEIENFKQGTQTLGMTPFPTLEEAHAYYLSDQSRQSPMPPISGIPSETSVITVRYAYPTPPSVSSQISNTSSPSLSSLPAASCNSHPPSPSRKKCDYCVRQILWPLMFSLRMKSTGFDSFSICLPHRQLLMQVYTRRHPGRQPPIPDFQTSSVAPGLPLATDSPLSGIDPSPTASIPVTTDDDSPVSHSDDDGPIAIRKEKRNARKLDRYSDTASIIKDDTDGKTSYKTVPVFLVWLPELDAFLGTVGVVAREVVVPVASVVDVVTQLVVGLFLEATDMSYKPGWSEASRSARILVNLQRSRRLPGRQLALDFRQQKIFSSRRQPAGVVKSDLLSSASALVVAGVRFSSLSSLAHESNFVWKPPSLRCCVKFSSEATDGANCSLQDPLRDDNM